MRHSCLASHLSSESTPLMGMGNVKTSPDDVFERHMFFFLCVSFILSRRPASQAETSCTEILIFNK